MKTGMIIVIAIVLILGAIIAYSLMSKADLSNTNSQIATGTEVKIKNFAFNPTNLKIKVSDIITWTNEENAIHTITSDSGSELNSENIGNGETYSHKFTTAGTYEYHCAKHSSMKGKIIVE